MAERKIAIVTDSTCDLPDDVMKENNIRFVPLRIVYEAAEYRDRLDITAEQVIGQLAREVPKSSMPLPQDVTDALDTLSAEGYTDVIYLSISAGLSGAYDLVRMLVQQRTGMRVEVVDTRSVSMGLGFLALEAAREAKRTGNPKAVVAKVQKIRSRMTVLFVIRTLEYLAKGGRIGKVEAALGSLIDIKPIITFGGEDGICHTVAKARGFNTSVRKMVSMVREKYEGKKINLAVMHAAALSEAGQLLEEVRKFATVCESFVAQLGPLLGIYSGPGLLGIVAYEAET